MSVSPSNSPRSLSSPLLISVLDQAPVSEGMSSAQALQNALDLATLADRLGYYRYWVAEHHGTTSLACASPEVLIGPIAAATSRLRLVAAASCCRITVHSKWPNLSACSAGCIRDASISGWVVRRAAMH